MLLYSVTFEVLQAEVTIFEIDFMATKKSQFKNITISLITWNAKEINNSFGNTEAEYMLL